MIIAKNPQLKQEAGWIKNLMLQQAYLEEKQTKIVGYDYDYRKRQINERTVEANLIVYKTDKGEYKHPIDLNAEMARRFEKLERMSSIDDGEKKASDKRALRLQELYSMLKAMPKKDVKTRLSKIRKRLADDEKLIGGRKTTYVDLYDELYVIEHLLKY